MKTERYKLMADHPLRQVLQSATNPPDMIPGRRQLRDDIAQALPDGTPEEHARLFALCEKTAREANADDEDARFTARQTVDAWLGDFLYEREMADRLVPYVDPAEEAARAADIAAGIAAGDFAPARQVRGGTRAEQPLADAFAGAPWPANS